MKKLLFILLASLIISGPLSAQNFYTRLGIGVSGKISSNLDLLYAYSDNGSSRMVTVVPVGFGRGFTGVAAFGYSPSKYISLEFGISQFLGFPNIADSIIKVPGGSSVEARIKGNMLSLLPSVVLSPGFENINPYARIGFVLGIRPTVNATVDAVNGTTHPIEEIQAVRHFYGGVATGINAAMGVSWKIDPMISLYAEFSFSSINYSPRSSEVVLYEKNGVDQLSTLTVKEKKTEYYANIYPDEQIPDTSPDKALRKTLPFSNAGLNFGIVFNF